ncbi:MAG: DUF167 domain-containing protein [Planctomycetota bacterium]|nr:DUF167 domain-containing protein [Planctomycetota bacterium]
MSPYTPVALVQTEQGVEIPIRVVSGASRNEIAGSRQGSLLVKTTAVPDKGKANRAIIELLAAELGLRKKDLDLVRGERHRNKCFLVRGTTTSVMEAKILSRIQPETE